MRKRRMIKMAYNIDSLKQYEGGACTMTEQNGFSTNGKLVKIEQKGNLLIFKSEIKNKIFPGSATVPYLVHADNCSIFQVDMFLFIVDKTDCRALTLIAKKSIN
jgi:hypothetical protein